MSQNILENIKKEMQNIISQKFNLRDINFNVSFIEDINKDFGDISANLAMVISKKINRNPKELAEEISQELNLKNIKTKIAGPGFINIFLSEEQVLNELAKINDKDFFIETKYTKQNILIEHSSLNLFKPFHVGHLTNNIIGESLVQMMKQTQAKIKIVSFPSDISLGIAKAIYIIKKNGIKKLKQLKQSKQGEIVKYLGEAYVGGAKFYLENPDRQLEIKQIAKNIFKDNFFHNLFNKDKKLYLLTRDINLKYFFNILKDLGSNLDKIIYESEAGVIGEKIVRENVGKGKVFEVGEFGAIFFDTKNKKNNKENSETVKSVFINREGHPTYESKDLGLLKLKKDVFLKENFIWDKNIFVTDNEQIPHFESVFKAAENINSEFRELVTKSQHVPHGRMTLKGEKMSSRLGNVFSAEEVLKITEEKTLNKLSQQKITDKTTELNSLELLDLIKNISLSALKIAILKSKPGLNIDFDPETSLNFIGATGPYLLYTYARGYSVLEKVASTASFDFSNRSLNENQLLLGKKIIESEVVYKNGMEDFAPQVIVKYLFELAQTFNSFYGKEKIISKEDLEKTSQNIYLLKIFLKTLKLGLNMIGIKEVRRM